MDLVQVDDRVLDGLTICSLEDEPHTIKGSLDSLEFDGHRIEVCETLPTARQLLREQKVNLVLLDEHVSGDDDAGTKLITELKSGDLGPRNVSAPFGFVTASRDWVDLEKVSSLQGYLGLEIKGSDLTRALKQWTNTLQEGADGSEQAILWRVPIYVEGIEMVEAETKSLRLIVPAWDPREKILYPVSKLLDEMQATPEELCERWFIARMNLHEADPTRIVIRDWEPQEPLDDDDGLA